MGFVFFLDGQRLLSLQSVSVNRTVDIKPQIRKKPVRSYVIRSGRMTAGQKAAYEDHWSDYGLDLHQQKIDFGAVFGRTAPLVLEIGCGMGDSLIDMCIEEPSYDFIGVEVHPPGVGRTINNAAEKQLKNLRVFLADAKDVMAECISDNSLSRVQVYFPDPWHKKKHNKRRLIQEEFVRQIATKLKPEGILHMATDWEQYAEQMLDVATAEPLLENILPSNGFSKRPDWRPETKFERRGERLGHGVWDLLLKKAV